MSNVKIFKKFLIATFIVVSFFFFWILVFAAHINPVADMDNYWWRDDDGSETAATGYGTGDAAKNTVIADVATNAQLRIRLGTTETAGGEFKNYDATVQFSTDVTSDDCTTGAWTTLDTSLTTWRIIDSTNFTDGDATTQQITAASFIAGKMKDTSNSATRISSMISQATEHEWMIEGNGAAGSTNYWFRVTNAGTAIDAYTVCAKLTTAAAGNSPPDEPSNVTLNDGNLITLTEDTTVAVTLKASTTDPDGADDIDSATGTIYRSGLGASCTADDNNCYRIASPSCVFAASTSTVTCTANIQFHADSTDASSSFPAQNWLGNITVTDKGGPASNSSTTATGVNLQTLWALNITAGNPIDYGVLNPDATSTDQIVTAKNTGNVAIDVELSGSDMTRTEGGSIAVNRQKYASSTISNWDTCTNCTALSGTETRLEMDLSKPTDAVTPVTGDVHWMLNIPAGTASGTYQGTSGDETIFTPIGD